MQWRAVFTELIAFIAFTELRIFRSPIVVGQDACYFSTCALLLSNHTFKSNKSPANLRVLASEESKFVLMLSKYNYTKCTVLLYMHIYRKEYIYRSYNFLLTNTPLASLTIPSDIGQRCAHLLMLAMTVAM